MAFTSDVVTIEYDGHVATLWLDRPDKRNAMNLPFWDDIPEAMEQLTNDDNVRAVVIAGRGPAFTVGITSTSWRRLPAKEPGPTRNGNWRATRQRSASSGP